MAYIGSDISKFNTADELTVSGDANVTGTVKPAGDTAAGDDAAIGYTAAEGLILTGQGSTSDITLKNDADATVFTVPTGTDDILFPDSAKAMFGAGSDLQIYHDGSNSYISDQGTNDLKVLATDFQLKNAADNEFMITAVTDGAVIMYHNNSAKIATTSTGATITGKVGIGTASPPDDLSVVTSGSNAQLSVDRSDGASGRTVLIHSSTGGQLQTTGSVPLLFGTADSERMRIGSSGLMSISAVDDSHNFKAFASDADSYFGVFDDGNNSANIEIRRSDAAQVFYVFGHTGNYHFAGSDTSDRDLKENIADVPDGSMGLVKQLKPRTFNFKKSEGFDTASRTGFIAQEVESVFTTDHHVCTGTDGLKDMGVDTVGIVAHLTKAIQELEARITALEAE